MPGKMTRCGALNIWLRTGADHRRPTPAVGGLAPSPRNESAATSRMAVAMPERALHDERRQRVRQDAAKQDPPLRLAERREAMTKSRSRIGEDRCAHDARVDRDGDDPDGEHRIQQRIVQERDLERPANAGGQEDGQDEGREREQDVHDPHEHVVDPAADVAGDGADERADDDRDADGDDADLERDPRAVDDAAEDVAPVLVEAHDELRLRLGAAEQVDARAASAAPRPAPRIGTSGS